MTDDLFASIDALLARPRPVDDLPVPAERERLRKLGEYTQEELAAALRTRRETIIRWEAGTTEPRPPKREVYIRFLATLALQHGTVEPAEWLRRAREAGLPRATGEASSDPGLAEAPAPAEAEPARAAAVPVPTVPEAFAAAVSEQPAPAAAQLVMLDQNPDGSLLMAAPAPCVQCGQPSVYRAQGLPMHLGGFCRPGVVPAVQQPVPQVPAEPVASVASVAAPRQAAPATGPVTAPRHAGSSRPVASSRARKAPAKAAAKAEGPSDWEAAAAARFPAGPLAVVDVAPDGKALVAYLADGTQAPTAPTGRTLADVVEWALETKLGSPRLHRHGKDGDALVVLTDAALAELGLPPMGRDEKTEFVPRLGQLPKTHKAVKAIEKAGWLLTQRGLGPWARVYRTPEDGKRVCVQLCIPAWGALASGGWQIPDGLDAVGLARLLGTYATRVLTPRGSTAVSGLELAMALRPPTQAVRTHAGWTSGPVDGSRTRAFDPAPPEVPEVHPLAEHRAPGDVLVTEAWDWHRALTEDEKAAPMAVGLDVNMAFLAAAGRLSLPLSEPAHVLEPVFDKKILGSWLVDLSHVATDPLLPSPFTQDGSRPAGPAWYSTVKVAYAIELGAKVHPLEGWLRRCETEHVIAPVFDKAMPGEWLIDPSMIDPKLPNPFTPDGRIPTTPTWYPTAQVHHAIQLGHPIQPLEGRLHHQNGPYLDPWHKRLRQAYLDTMAALGVPLDLADRDPVAFLGAMAAIKATGDPAELAVLTAIKQTAKGTIGKLRERPRQGWKPGERWAALERPTWDPLMRALVIDTATVNFHRKLRRMAAETGLHAIAVLSDCAVFAAPGPGALDVLARPDGTLTTALRLGVSPGHVKFEGARPMEEVLELIADGANPGRHMKAGGQVSADE
ncbi:helix-turn-helix domain-containing protein [Kitasatospora aureofaciens]|uniref:helix-turn-helix domain-containing protein n=1 Tax=Kitasatospora aureofaciens TaxID=1894 RepID=UPI003807095A